MAGPNAVSRLELYSGSGRQRLWRGFTAAAGLALALGAGGCSISSPAFDSVFGGSANAEQTGSIVPSPGARQTAELPPDGDLVYARAAASEVLGRGVQYSSQAWENPATGARGTVTPVAAAYTQDGQTCRDFLASYVTGSSQSWLQGEACKPQKGAWEVRTIKPWKRS